MAGIGQISGLAPPPKAKISLMTAHGMGRVIMHRRPPALRICPPAALKRAGIIGCLPPALLQQLLSRRPNRPRAALLQPNPQRVHIPPQLNFNVHPALPFCRLLRGRRSFSHIISPGLFIFIHRIISPGLFICIHRIISPGLFIFIHRIISPGLFICIHHIISPGLFIFIHRIISPGLFICIHRIISPGCSFAFIAFFFLLKSLLQRKNRFTRGLGGIPNFPP
jgi:hypothetical protein